MSDSLTSMPGAGVRAATREAIRVPPVTTSARPGCIEGSARISATVIRRSFSSSAATWSDGISDPCTRDRSYCGSPR